MPKDKNPTERLLELNRIFNERFGGRSVVKSAELIERFGISLRQLRTDTDALKAKGAPLEYDPKQRGWHYAERFLFTDSLSLSLDDVAQLRIAAETLSAFSHLDGYRELPEIVNKIHHTVRRWMADKTPSRAIYFDTPPSYEGTTHLSFFLKAIEESRRVVFDYHPFHALQPKRVLFDPYFLRQYDHRWYVGGVSHDPEEGFIRTFPLERIISEPELAGFFHDKPKDYAPESYWRDIYGISRPPNAQSEIVILAFDPLPGKYFRSKPFFEPFKVMEDSEERFIVQFRIVVNMELVSKIASLGHGVKVLSPSSLIKKMVDYFRSGLSRYE
jgi:predicted DNA-binding transcriptional regulator YafY